jgi:metal-responsive CopG/Arc/MetJ family transcriptional regulator
MDKEKIAITLDKRYIGELDRMVESHVFHSRSQAIQVAVGEKLARMRRTRLAKECGKLDAVSERKMTEEGFAEDMKIWPEY